MLIAIAIHQKLGMHCQSGKKLLEDIFVTARGVQLAEI
jgi:hypothetical protein